MKSLLAKIISRSFAGLKLSYYLRELFYGSIVAVALYFMMNNATISKGKPMPSGMTPFLIFNALLYPYARFIYKLIMEKLMGNNVIFSNILLFLGWKFFTIMMCYIFAIFIAPIGLLYLFFYHTKEARALAMEQEQV